MSCPAFNGSVPSLSAEDLHHSILEEQPDVRIHPRLSFQTSTITDFRTASSIPTYRSIRNLINIGLAGSVNAGLVLSDGSHSVGISYISFE
ncbi:hypothetical protein WAI453_006969 [Rhynchosporium graminicola]